jgi:hypothetical protein
MSILNAPFVSSMMILFCIVSKYRGSCDVCCFAVCIYDESARACHCYKYGYKNEISMNVNKSSF